MVIGKLEPLKIDVQKLLKDFADPRKLSGTILVAIDWEVAHNPFFWPGPKDDDQT